MSRMVDGRISEADGMAALSWTSPPGNTEDRRSALDHVGRARRRRAQIVAPRKTTGALYAHAHAVITGSPACAWPWKPGGGCGAVNSSFSFMWCHLVIPSRMIVQLPVHRAALHHCRPRGSEDVPRLCLDQQWGRSR
jgi:hypothetical protein